jgi:antitoxin (DNA-binding transcriptional repressor) of toxin-antitoxin stability system
MLTATVEQVQTDLPALVAKLCPGEELLITQMDQPIARLVAEPPKKPAKRKLGGAIGILKILQDDDSYLEDFRETS